MPSHNQEEQEYQDQLDRANDEGLATDNDFADSWNKEPENEDQ